MNAESRPKIGEIAEILNAPVSMKGDLSKQRWEWSVEYDELPTVFSEPTWNEEDMWRGLSITYDEIWEKFEEVGQFSYSWDLAKQELNFDSCETIFDDDDIIRSSTSKLVENGSHVKMVAEESQFTISLETDLGTVNKWVINDKLTSEETFLYTDRGQPPILDKYVFMEWEIIKEFILPSKTAIPTSTV